MQHDDRQPEIRSREQRVALARFAIDFSKEMHRTMFPSRARDFASRMDVVFVACCVTIGQLSDRPMTASRVATFLGISRSTATRRLRELCRDGLVERQGSKYLISRFHKIDDKTLSRFARHFNDLLAVIE